MNDPGESHDHPTGRGSHTHTALDMPYGLPDWAFEDGLVGDRATAQSVVAIDNTDENDNLGLPTFGNREWVGTSAALAARRPDVAIVGAPFDINTTNRAGARFGPKYLRSSAYDPGTYHLDLGVELYDWLDVVDNGDAYCPHGQTGPSLRNI